MVLPFAVFFGFLKKLLIVSKIGEVFEGFFMRLVLLDFERAWV
jgi:hypothetical protein